MLNLALPILNPEVVCNDIDSTLNVGHLHTDMSKYEWKNLQDFAMITVHNLSPPR